VGYNTSNVELLKLQGIGLVVKTPQVLDPEVSGLSSARAPGGR